MSPAENHYLNRMLRHQHGDLKGTYGTGKNLTKDQMLMDLSYHPCLGKNEAKQNKVYHQDFVTHITEDKEETKVAEKSENKTIEKLSIKDEKVKLPVYGNYGSINEKMEPTLVEQGMVTSSTKPSSNTKKLVFLVLACLFFLGSFFYLYYYYNYCMK